MPAPGHFYFLAEYDDIADRPRDIAGLARVAELATRGLQVDDEVEGDQGLIVYLLDALATVTATAADRSRRQLEGLGKDGA